MAKSTCIKKKKKKNMAAIFHHYKLAILILHEDNIISFISKVEVNKKCCFPPPFCF